MAKSLGQIHTVNTTRSVDATGEVLDIDLPGELTNQLSRMIRQGNYFKVVGIDLGVDTAGTVGGGQVSGFFRYYAPTRGRCNAFKGAFKAMADAMKMQGINMRDNKLYDFRAPINNARESLFPNQATLDGVGGLCLNHTTEPGQSIFGVHNRSQQPQYTGTAGDLFQPGFDTLIQDAATGTDFILNDAIPYTGDANFAETEYETIPFNLSWTPDSTDIVTNFQWRPDPALYLAILCGQLQLVVEEINLDSEASALNVYVAVHVSGWKSIMGNPDKKRRKGTRHKKSHSSKRRS